MTATERDRRAALLAEFVETQQALGDLLVGRRLQRLVDTRLTAQQLRAIAILLLDGQISAHELARALGVSAATVSGILDRLEAAGMVERRVDEADGRVRRIAVTPSGTAAVRGIVADDDHSVEVELLEDLSTAELEQITTGFGALLRVTRDSTPAG
ncbi:MarR family winged helix-turn-helix transcriptional regulator [Cellulomonas sp. PhB143]|uniref:MarR family winged helix-turn-helix transcriptional regulator n=1 Tax=Cellulomonas sp. PhB143 TaxID=2485186 RepID=UPI000FB9B157|nr:MarR family transcriptional regulator [Cellulomonas sp. PhB143]ROS78650.1 DNA-binding MarR family transcriptional regulator [Cellulomonas sp. PhB143]